MTKKTFRNPFFPWSFNEAMKGEQFFARFFLKSDG